MNNKTSHIILLLILSAFVLRGIVMIVLIPVFFGPDEDVHFATVQFRAEAEHTPPSEAITSTQKYRYSEELLTALEATEFFKIKPMSENIVEYVNGQTDGKNEEILKTAAADRINRFASPRIATYPPLYYSLLVPIEETAPNLDLLSRISLMRFISLVIGVLTLLVVYFAAKEIGFSRNESLLFTAIVSFQPMFLFVSSVINPDILLIFSFTLFTHASLHLLHHGFSQKNGILLLLAIVIGIFTKGPAMVLPIIALALVFYKLVETKQIRLQWLLAGSGIFCVIAGALLFLTPIWETYVAPNIVNGSSAFPSPLASLKEYASQTLDYEHIILQSSLSYWGNFGWLDAPISQQMTWVIVGIEIAAVIGVMLFFFQRGHAREKRDVIFLLIMLAALQALVRYYDWHVFNYLGRLELNTQGRYFLPNVFSHLYLVLFGLCILLRQRMRPMLEFALVALVSLTTYSFFWIIIPRFYW